MDGISVGSEYAEHVTEADVRLLTAITGRPAAPPMSFPGSWPIRASSKPSSAPWRPHPVRPFWPHRFWLSPSPCIARPRDLATARHVPERSVAGQRLPVFDAPDLRDFLGSATRRLFLTELLNSFTRVTSGRYQVGVGGRAKTRRFSELDPVRLAALLDAAPEESRPGIYRRLGDVALFLSGVFPDYVAARAFGPVNAARLLRAARVPASEQERLVATPDIELLEHLGTPVGAGRRWPWPRCKPDGWLS